MRRNAGIVKRLLHDMWTRQARAPAKSPPPGSPPAAADISLIFKSLLHDGERIHCFDVFDNAGS